MADDPSHYIRDGKEEAGLTFLRGLPTVWDETRALHGVIGEHVVVARRSGANWWLGGITGERDYSSTLSLSFLGAGSFKAHVYRDVTDVQEPYTAVQEETRQVTARDVLPIRFRAGGGGMAIRFEKTPAVTRPN